MSTMMLVISVKFSTSANYSTDVRRRYGRNPRTPHSEEHGKWYDLHI